jgi:hypothetical protein
LVAVPLELDGRSPRRRNVLPRRALDARRNRPVPGGLRDGAECDVSVDAEQLPTQARQRIGPLRFTTEPVAHAPVLLVADDGRESRFPRAMCRFTTDDGRQGTGWTEYNWPETPSGS